MASVNRIRGISAAALLLGASLCALAQSHPGALSGKLTDLYSVPQPQATIVLRNELTGSIYRTQTARDGSYLFLDLPPGRYTVEAQNGHGGQGRISGVLVQTGAKARVQTAMAFRPAPRQSLPALAAEIPTETVLPLAELPRQPQHSFSLRARPLSTLALPPLEVERETLQSALHIEALAARPFKALPERVPSKTPRTRETQTRTGIPPTAPQTTALAPEQKTAAVQASRLSASESVQTTATQPTAPQTATLAPEQKIATTQASRLSTSESALTTGALPAAPQTTLTGAEIHALPASGRNWEQFALDTPSASSAPGAGRVSMSGPGGEETETTIDGVSTRLAFGEPTRQGQSTAGQTESLPAGTGSAWTNGHGYAVSEAAVKQVSTSTTQAGVETAHAAGGEINVETEQGTPELHGQAFFYDKQNLWNARNPFTTRVLESAAGSASTLPSFTATPYTPPDSEQIWGVGLGSRMRRRKILWFAALDHMHRNDPGVAMVKHPDDFFAQPKNDRMQVLGAQLGSSSLAIPKYSQMLETLAGLLGPAQRTSSQWMGFGRLDRNLGERHRISLEATSAHRDAPGGGMTRISEAYGNHSFGSSEARESWGLGRWESFLTPNLLSVTQLSAGQTVHNARPSEPSEYEKTLNINVWGQLPQIVIDSTDGFTIGNPARFGKGSYPNERALHAQEAVNWVRGKWLVKAGVQFDRHTDRVGLLRNQTGTYHYSSVENFATDALAFAANGLTDALDKYHQHNCDQTGKAWRDSAGQLRGLGYLPCYSYYTQTMGPSNWHIATNDLAGYVQAQWQISSFAVLSMGLRWERELLPPAIAAVANADLPSAGKPPALGNSWGPRIGLAFGDEQRRWPVFRIGYGAYYGRLQNSTLEVMLSHTGSVNGDLSFYLRPTDNLNAGGAPPFPYVFGGEPLKLVKPGAVSFAERFRLPEIHQAVATVEKTLPGHLQVSASAQLSLGRRLPVTADTNIDPSVNLGTITYAVVDTSGKGPIKAARITSPFYATWPSKAARPGTNYQQIVEMSSRANSTYEAAVLRLDRYGRRGLMLHAHYTYSHAIDWNPNESLRLTGGSLFDPGNFALEYGTSNLDVRHSASAVAIYSTQWKLQGLAGRIANNWFASGVGRYRSGLPYTMRTAGSLPKEFAVSTGTPIVGLGTGMNGAGGDNRLFGYGNNGITYNLGRNSYRYPENWKIDTRLGKRFALGNQRSLEVFAESFNLFNHRNVTSIETIGYIIEPGTISGGLPTLNFMTGLKTGSNAFGKPLNSSVMNFYRERQIEFGTRLRF